MAHGLSAPPPPLEPASQLKIDKKCRTSRGAAPRAPSDPARTPSARAARPGRMRHLASLPTWKPPRTREVDAGGRARRMFS